MDDAPASPLDGVQELAERGSSLVYPLLCVNCITPFTVRPLPLPAAVWAQQYKDALRQRAAYEQLRSVVAAQTRAYLAALGERYRSASPAAARLPINASPLEASAGQEADDGALPWSALVARAVREEDAEEGGSPSLSGVSDLTVTSPTSLSADSSGSEEAVTIPGDATSERVVRILLRLQEWVGALMERAGQAHASLQSLLPSLAPLPPLQSPERAALREFVLPTVDASTRPELPPDLLAAQRCPSCGWQYTPASVSANVWADDGSVHCLPRVPPCNLPMLHQTLNVVPSTLSSLRDDAVVRVLTEPPVDGAAYCAAQGLDEARIAGVLGGHAAPASARSGLHSLAVELSHGPDLSSLVPTGVGFLPLTGIVFDEDMLLHEEVARSDTTSTIAGITLPLFQSPRAHPERPDRMRAIAQHLVATGLFERCKRIASRCCRRDELELVHAGEYLDRLQRLTADVQSRGGLYSLNSDTYANEHTQRAAELACGSTIALVEEIIRGRVDRGLAIVRPPGHHAEAGEAMGFCFFNNAAVAAAVATRVWGMQRVLIVDWDVHHGNGTENIFYDDPRVLYMSLHRFDGGSFYPGTGAAHHIGEGAGKGYNVNVPWSRGGMGDTEYMFAFDTLLLPIARAYAPQLIIISAGFDSARGDPLGGCDLTPAGYAHMTHALLGVCGRMAVVLEGGYNLRSISRGMEAVVRVMLGQTPPPLNRVPSTVHADAADANSTAGLEAFVPTQPRLLRFVRKLHTIDSGIVPAEQYGIDDTVAEEAAASGSGEAVLRIPRADAFAMSADDQAEMTAEFNGATRSMALAGAFRAHPSAVRAVMSAVGEQAQFWPHLDITHKMYAALVAAREAAATAAEAAAAAEGALSSSHDDSGVEDLILPSDEEDDSQADDLHYMHEYGSGSEVEGDEGEGTSSAYERQEGGGASGASSTMEGGVETAHAPAPVTGVVHHPSPAKRARRSMDSNA